TTEVYLYEAPKTQEVTVRACKVMVAYYISHCGTASHNSLIHYDAYPSPLIPTEAECEGYHATRMMTMGDAKATLTMNATVHVREIKVGSLAADGSCTQGTFVHKDVTYSKVYVIASYAVTILETKLLFDRESGYSAARYRTCHLSTRTCAADDMRLNYRKPYELCPLMRLKRFNAEMLQGYMYEYGVRQRKILPIRRPNVSESETQRLEISETPTVLISEEEGVVLIRKKTVIKCEQNVYLTNYPDLYVTDKPIPGASMLEPAEIDLSKYFNAKLDYVVYTNHGLQKTLYYDIVNRICELKYTMLKNKLAIISKHPELAGSLLTEKQGVYGLKAGEVVYFYSCAPASVTVRQQPECTQELPVTYQNSSWFVTPFSRILVKEAAPVPCTDLAPPQYWVGDTYWVTYKGLTPGHPPQYLDPQDPVYDLGFVNLEELRKKGLYTPEQLEGAHRAMLFPRNHEVVVQQIVSGGTMNYASSQWRPENLLDERFHENIMNRFVKKVWGIFAFVGNFISGLIGIYFCYQIV
ncbi:MAG TPA: hypothetical protein VK861_03280, partial [Bacteroidales bacterium]|nr:hypothetical protein [Bacteroidales bacterium]